MSHCELSLLDSVAQPEKANVHALGTLCVNSISRKAFGDGVINHDHGGFLGISKFLQSVAEFDSLVGSLERST